MRSSHPMHFAKKLSEVMIYDGLIDFFFAETTITYEFLSNSVYADIHDLITCYQLFSACYAF